MRLIGLVVISATVCGAGELTRRFELTLDRVLRGGGPAYDIPLLTADVIPNDSRVFTNFSGDLSGRYLGALASAGQTDQALEVLPHLLLHQRPDGSFGNPLSPSGATEDDMARLWGAGRMLVGLVELHRASGDERAIGAALRLGEWLIRQAPRFNSDLVQQQFAEGKLAVGYICWTQNVEALALLADALPEEESARFRSAAESIAERIERRPGQHTHGWLTSMRGLLSLPARLPTAQWSEFAASGDLLPHGTVSEYFPPGLARDEGCSHADWVRWNLAMPPEDRYLEAAEKALYNGFYPNQSSSGGFGHLTFTPLGFAPGHEEAWWCCTLHGLRTFRDIRKAAFSRTGDGGVRYQLPVDGEIALETEEGPFLARADSTLEADDTVRIEIVEGAIDGFSVRQPSWSGPLVFELNEDPLPELTGARLDAGDRLTVTYAPQERTVDGIEYQGPWIMATPSGRAGTRVRLADRTWASPDVEWRFLPDEQPLPLAGKAGASRVLRVVFPAAAIAGLLLWSLLWRGRKD